MKSTRRPHGVCLFSLLLLVLLLFPVRSLGGGGGFRLGRLRRFLLSAFLSLSRDEFEQAIDVLAGVDKAGDVEGGTADLKVAACSLDRQR